MKKMALNESTKYYVDLTISKYLGTRIDTQNTLSNTKEQKQIHYPNDQKSNIKCNNMC